MRVSSQTQHSQEWFFLLEEGDGHIVLVSQLFESIHHRKGSDYESRANKVKILLLLLHLPQIPLDSINTALHTYKSPLYISYNFGSTHLIAPYLSTHLQLYRQGALSPSHPTVYDGLTLPLFSITNVCTQKS
jgi:hypothetical protein